MSDSIEHQSNAKNLRPSIVPTRANVAAEIYKLGTLTVAEVASVLHVSSGTVRRAIRDGRIKAARFGNKLIVPVEEVEKLRRQSGGSPAARFEPGLRAMREANEMRNGAQRRAKELLAELDSKAERADDDEPRHRAARK